MATKYIDKLIHHSYFDPESGIVWREIVARWGQADYDDLTKRKEHQDTLSLEWDAYQYARNRVSAYDSVGNQLDMLMKDMKNNTTTHQESCEAVKARFPKP